MVNKPFVKTYCVPGTVLMCFAFFNSHNYYARHHCFIKMRLMELLSSPSHQESTTFSNPLLSLQWSNFWSKLSTGTPVTEITNDLGDINLGDIFWWSSDFLLHSPLVPIPSLIVSMTIVCSRTTSLTYLFPHIFLCHFSFVSSFLNAGLLQEHILPPP